MIRILITDDHTLIREGFKKILNREIDMSVIGEACNAAETMEMIRTLEFDVLVLDISMPGRTGLEIIQDIKKEAPDSKILILSMHPEQRFAMRALKSGADGYITKESVADELVNAIRKIVTGRKFISQAMAEEIAQDLGRGMDKPYHEQLSDREFEVFMLLGSGKSSREISEQLSLSLSTVNTYRARILHKMGMNSNAELIHYAVKNKLVD